MLAGISRGDELIGRRFKDEPGVLGTGATSPRTSTGYTATFALLQASITAFNSDSSSIVMGKPALSMTRVFRPGAEASPLATFRRARKTLRAPKSASSPPNPGVSNIDVGL